MCVGKVKVMIKVTYVLGFWYWGRRYTKSNLVSLEVLPVCTYMLPLAVLSLLEAQLEALFMYSCVNCCCSLLKFYKNKTVTSEPRLEEDQNIACTEWDVDMVVVGGGWNLVLSLSLSLTHTHTHWWRCDKVHCYVKDPIVSHFWVLFAKRHPSRA
jgi:hypothetical protein